MKKTPDCDLPAPDIFDEFFKGSGKREVATTMSAVQMLSKLLKDKNAGKLVVPLFPMNRVHSVWIHYSGRLEFIRIKASCTNRLTAKA
jgi:pyruvate dehydrogenase complex dehydrogenase (E1) component